MEELLKEAVEKKMMQDIDGVAFYIYQRRNGQDANRLVLDAKNLIVEHNLSVSEAKGFLEYMKVIVDSVGSLHHTK